MLSFIDANLLPLAKALVVAMIASILAVLILIPLAKQTGWIDQPDHRKKHAKPTPLVGGAAIVLAFLIASSTIAELRYPSWFPIAVLVIFIVGFIDDKFPLRARYRFLAQLLAAAMVVFGDSIILQNLGEILPLTAIGLNLLAVPVTIVGIVGLVNAVNMIDGADGLCAGVSLIGLAWLAFALFLIVPIDTFPTPASQPASVFAAMIGAVLGFSLFNVRSPIRKRATVFLGDGGSMVLGFTLAWGCVALTSQFGQERLPPAAAAWIVALPLIDLFSCIFRRISEGKTPMTADRRHLHHFLQEQGFDTNKTVQLMQFLSFFGGAVGIIGWQIGLPDSILFWSLAFVAIIYHFQSVNYWKKTEGHPLDRKF